MSVTHEGQRRGNWVRDSEHIVFRVVSLAFSIGSAYAVREFFEPLDTGDPIHYALWWIVAGGFGVLGFYLSRGIAHRMMNKESIWVYAPLFVLIEFFEILCNYAKAVAAVATGAVPWVMHAPAAQQFAMAFLTYVGWSILPLVSPMMAAVDVDVMRRRIGEVVHQQRPAVARPGNPVVAPLPMKHPGGPQPLPKPGGQNGTAQPWQAGAPVRKGGPQNNASPLPGLTPVP
jgi:hypothetical protein